MKILFFDTETTGLPKNWRAPMSDLNNWPDVIQLAWVVTDRDGNVLRRQKHMIKPDGWKVPVEKFWIDNGYSTEGCERDGIPMMYALDIFNSDLFTANVLVSHNMDYDYNVLGAEMLRRGNKVTLAALTRICTKVASTAYCKIPQTSGWGRGYKWPTLTELHTHLFGTGFDGAHDALADVIACKNSFFELVNRGVIKLPNVATESVLPAP